MEIAILSRLNWAKLTEQFAKSYHFLGWDRVWLLRGIISV
ncbi:hypothetical protein NSP_24440 [Nodularia spumigena CCY9414]|nr:hypothetical protein NSP_24440 [Nodularia spumigena CCY9414]